MKTLYIFVDESGNFDFSSSGTKNFILTLLSTIEPSKIGQSLMELRYELLKNYGCGDRLEERGYFHATEDYQAVRDQVFTALLKERDHIRVDSVIAQKNKANPVFHKDEARFYRIIGEAAPSTLLREQGENNTNTS